MNPHPRPLPKVIVETRKLAADRARVRLAAPMLPPRRGIQRAESSREIARGRAA